MKGIAIILMVAGHTELPTLIHDFIYVFHMPLFFITAGYFFTKSAGNTPPPREFVKKRFKGLYVTFIKWSVLFLLLHNLWLAVGLLHTSTGSVDGSTPVWYGLTDFAKRLATLPTLMSGYDEFMNGAFWFFRALLVASLVYLALHLLAGKATGRGVTSCALLICGAALAFQTTRLGLGFSLPVIPGGGLREIWGLFFFGIGVAFRQVEHRIPNNPWLTGICFCILCVGAWFGWCGMENHGTLRDVFTLPLTGTAGFIATRHLASLIASVPSRTSRFLAFAGENTLYVLIFHTLCFKPVSAAKIMWYGLDWDQLGCHMVIHFNSQEDLFWIAYTIVGTLLSLGLAMVIRKIPAPKLPRLLPRFQN